MRREPPPRLGWAELAAFVLLYVIALGFAVISARSAFGIAVLALILVAGAATFLLLVRTKKPR